MPYAYVCRRCHHLTSRHFLAETDPNATLVDGPYLCSHRDCQCAVSQTDPSTAISERQFEERFADTLDEYEDPHLDAGGER